MTIVYSPSKSDYHKQKNKKIMVFSISHYCKFLLVDNIFHCDYFFDTYNYKRSVPFYLFAVAN